MKHAAILLLVVAAAAVAGCETSSTVSASPDPVKCQVSLASPVMVDAGGGMNALAITTQPECAWNAATSANWISGFSPASGQGTVSMAFRVAPNEGSSSREAMIVVNGEQARVSQRAPCRFDVGPSSLSMSAGGGASSVNVGTLADCAWTATAEVIWITLTGPLSGSGNGTVNFTVAANGGEQRAGSILIGNQRTTVTQAGVSAAPAPPPPPSPTPACSPTISSTSQSVAAAGGAVSVAVSAQSGCGWTATSGASWITLTSGSTGSGNGSVAFNVAANTGASRTGTLTIAGRTFTVTQAAASGEPPAPQPPPPPPPAPSCTYSISPSSHNFNALGGGDGVEVRTQTGCAWTATSNASWIAVLSGASGTGNGDVGIGVAPNLGAARTGTVTIAGQTYTATQAAVAPCSYSISPSKQDIGASGGTASVSVNTTSNCAWTGASNVSWITITSGASGTNDGTVTFNVAPNTGPKRKGSLTIAGRTAEVEQGDR